MWTAVDDFIACVTIFDDVVMVNIDFVAGALMNLMCWYFDMGWKCWFFARRSPSTDIFS